MYQIFHFYVSDVLAVFALIAALFAGWKILHKPTMNLLKKFIGVAILEENQNKMAITLEFLAEKANQIHTQLTINGGTITIKDDLGMIKDSLAVIRAEQMATIELSSIPTFINNGDGECTFVNQALCNLFGAKSKEEMLMFSWTNFLDDNEKHIKADNYIRSLEVNNVIRDSYHVNNPIKKTRTFCEYNATVTRDKSGKIRSVIGNVRSLE